jgi:hypothetical protein
VPSRRLVRFGRPRALKTFNQQIGLFDGNSVRPRATERGSEDERTGSRILQGRLGLEL